MIGQDHALEAIAQRIRTARAKLDDPRKPIGVFLLVGPSGVGKTETALALADLLYGGERNMITINMSEYQEAHTVSSLKGSPPGYVGYGEGGVLTEAVRRKPYSVVLLDEVEKAHPDVHGALLPGLRQGHAGGRRRPRDRLQEHHHPLTSNAGTDTIMKLCADPETCPSAEALGRGAAARAAQGRSSRRFSAALIVVPVLSRWPTRSCAADHRAAARPHRPALLENHRAALHLRRRRWSRRSPAAAPRSRAAPATSTTS